MAMLAIRFAAMGAAFAASGPMVVEGPTSPQKHSSVVWFRNIEIKAVM
jgi:hypothetical protein